MYSILSCVRIHMNRNSSKEHWVEGPVTYAFTLHLTVRDHTPWFWNSLGTAFGHHFQLGSPNFMVTALGPYVKVAFCLTHLRAMPHLLVVCELGQHILALPQPDGDGFENVRCTYKYCSIYLPSKGVPRRPLDTFPKIHKKRNKITWNGLGL